ncbi:MAG: FAD-dependent oxidoreductase, partial [Clostridia bacterium]|nr:FAD-dependent oxidoreductase [Clostridia bacterium]
PFEILYGEEVKNLAVAGRCVSTDEEMAEVTRVIPSCAVTGQAAGTAAAMCDDFTTLDVKKLQEKLVANGVKLHETDL